MTIMRITRFGWRVGAGFLAGAILTAVLGCSSKTPVSANPPATTAPSSPTAIPADDTSTATPTTNPSSADLLSQLGLSPVQGNPALLDFKAQTLDGKTVNLSDYKGKVILLNFWATWCPPCRAEMPTIEKLYQALKGNPHFVFLAVDAQEKPDVVKAFLTKTDYHFPVLLDTSGQAGAEYSVQAIPTTYLIDTSGHVLGGAAGGREWDRPEVIQALIDLTQAQ